MLLNEDGPYLGNNRAGWCLQQGSRPLVHRELPEAYGLFAVNSILFNHESPRRGEIFVARKITRALGRIRMGLQEKRYLGTWMPVATGDMRRMTSRQCGGVRA